MATDEQLDATVQRVIDAVHRAELQDDAKIQQLLRRVLRRPDAKTLKRIQTLVNKRQVARLTNSLPRPGSELEQGNIELGKDLFEDRKLFCDFQKTLSSHGIVLARSGHGKSTLIAHLVPQIARVDQVKGILAFDCGKLGLRVIKHLLPELEVARPADIHMNPCQIEEGVNAKDALQPQADAIADALDATEPGRRWVTQCLDRSYRDRGVYDLNPRNPPTLAELRSYLIKGRDRKVVDGLVNRVDPCLQNTNMFATRIGWTTKAMSQMCCLCELESQNKTIQKLAIGPTIAKEFVRRKYTRPPNQHSDYFVFLLDDTQHLCEQENSFIVQYINVVRSADLVFLLALQGLTGVHSQIVENCGSIFCGHLRDPQHRDTVLRAMAMMTLSEQRSIVRKQSQKGVFLLSVPDMWPHPFFVRVAKRKKDLPFPETHDPGALRDLPVEKKESELNWKPPEWVLTDPSDNPFGLSDDQMRYLRTVRANKGKALTEMSEYSGLGSRATKVRNSLLEKGMLHSQDVKLEGRGKPRTLLTLSPKGEQALKPKKGRHGD